MGTLLSKKKINTDVTVDTRLQTPKTPIRTAKKDEEGKDKNSPKIFPSMTHVIERPEHSKILTQFILNHALYDDDQTPAHSKKM